MKILLTSFSILILCSTFFVARAQNEVTTEQLSSTSNPSVESRVKPILTIDGLQFRDLNDNGNLDAYEDWRLPLEQRVDNLISMMTQEELVGQMFYKISQVTPDGGAESIKETEHLMVNEKLTHFVNDGNAHPSVYAAYSNSLQEIAESGRLGIPLVFHSHANADRNPLAWTNFPWPLGLGASNNLDLIERWGEVIAAEYRAMGLHVRIYPMIDVATEPRWARIQDLFNEDANQVTAMTLAYLKGSNGEDGGPAILSEVKHFPGGGAGPGGADPHNEEGSVYTFPGDNFEYHLIPWRAVIEAGVRRIMPYYYIYPDYDSVAISFSENMLAGLLRNELGFNGIISSDWQAVSLRSWGVDSAVSQKEKYLMAIMAGMDQLAVREDTTLVNELVSEGRLPLERVEEAARRTLMEKFRLGLFENPYVDTERAAEIVGSDEHRAVARQAHLESIVLLTNTGLLPLPEARIDTESGNARWQRIFLLDVDPEEASKYGVVVDDLDEADVAILRVDPFVVEYAQSSELAFPEETKAIVDVVTDSGVPTILAVNFHRAGPIPQQVIESTGAILGTFESNDAALLDIVFGRFNPTGRLPVQIPSSTESLEKQFEDVPFDLENPLFDHGFGISYE